MMSAIGSSLFNLGIILLIFSAIIYIIKNKLAEMDKRIDSLSKIMEEIHSIINSGNNTPIVRSVPITRPVVSDDEDNDDDNDGFIDMLDKFPKYAGFNTDQIPTESNDQSSDSDSIFVGGTAILLLFTTSLVLSIIFGVKKLMEVKESSQEQLEDSGQQEQSISKVEDVKQ